MQSANLRLCLALSLLLALSCAKDDLTISPTRVTLQTGQSQQFTASGSVDKWSVAGIPWGNSVYGHITQGGYYTAPDQVPTPDSVAVTAENSSGTVSAIVLIRPSGGR